MFHLLKRGRLAHLAIGVGIGLAAALVVMGLWPEKPVHAVATDRYETFAMATGAVDDEFEAVFFLDFLTGDLRAVVLGKQANRFTAFFTYSNVLNDLGVDPSKNPRFMMVTGIANRPRGGGTFQQSLSVVYVAEITGGKVAAYAIPWSKGQHVRGNMVGPMQLIPLAVTQFRAAPLAPPAAPGAGP